VRTSLVSGVAAGFVLVVATACGGGTTATTKPAGSVAGPASAPAAASQAAASQAAAGGAPTCTPGLDTTATQVGIANFAYNPSQAATTAGKSVSWTNADSAAHTVTFDSGPDCGNLATAASVSATFPSAGSYPYHCTIHPSMKGTVTVS
jgi:plastocyanin